MRVTQSGGSGQAFYMPSWSPDGSKLVTYVGSDGVHDIETVGVAGSEGRPLSGQAEDEYWPVWGPAGRVVYFRVIDPRKAVVEVENYLYATSQLSQTTLSSVLGQAELDDLLSQRDRLNQQLQHILDNETEPWGIKVSAVEVKNVDLPQEMQRAMARQAEAEREKRAKIIHADGELQASEKLSQAAAVIEREPAAMTLRYLQTLTEIASEQNSTILFPVPIELMRFIRGADERK